jgi:ligand-binding SRPBCC domain-containing protein
MKLMLRTPVNAPLATVWNGFDESLFKKLSPPFPPVKLVRFDGSQTGDVVSLELNFLLFKQKWTSLITDQRETEQEIYFIDEGRELPFFLSYWRHKHRLIRTEGNGTLIADEIEYRTPFILFDYLMYPLLRGQFAYRGPIYKRLFS